MKKILLSLLFTSFLIACLPEQVSLPTSTVIVPSKTATLQSISVSTVTPSPNDFICDDNEGEIQQPFDVYFENGEISRIGNGQLYGIDWSRDGTKLAIGSETGVYIFDTISMKKLRFIDIGHATEVVKFSPNGQHIATSYYLSQKGYSTVALWSIETGDFIGELGKHIHFYSARWVSPVTPVLGNISFSPDGKLIALHAMNYADMDSNPSVQVWDTTNFSLVREWSSNGVDFQGVILPDPVFSSDGKKIISPWKEGLIIWDVETGNVIEEIKDKTKISFFNLSGQKIFTTSMLFSDRLELIDLQTRKSIVIPPTVNLKFPNIIGKFSHNDERIILYVSSTEKTYIEIINAETGEFIRSLPLTDYVFGFAVNPTKNELATIDYKQNIHIWNIENGKLIRTHRFSDYIGSEVYPSPDGSILVVKKDKNFHLYNAKNGEYLCTLQEDIVEPYFFSFNPNGQEFAYINPLGNAVVWDLTSGFIKQIIKPEQLTNSNSQENVPLIYHKTPISNQRYNLFVWGWKDEVHNKVTWIGTSCDALESIPTSCPGIISQDGKFIASISQNTLLIQDANTYKQVYQIDEFNGSNNYAFSPDGKYLLSLRFLDWGIDVWDTSTLKKVTKINSGMEGEGPILGVQEFSFTLDGSRLVTYLPYFQKNGVRLWDTQTWELIQSFDSLGGVGDAKISGDGSLIAGLSGYAIYLWRPDK